MPAYCMGMADVYEGPIEDEAWLGDQAHARARQRGAVAAPHRDVIARRRRRLRAGVEVRSRHHGAAALPDAALRPAGDSGEHQLPGPAADAAEARLRVRPRAAPRLRRAARAHRAGRHGRHLALAGHARLRNDQRSVGSRVPRAVPRQRSRDELLARTRDEETWRDAGQGGFEIRTFITVAGATEGATGELWFYAPIPIFAVGCTVATMAIPSA